MPHYLSASWLPADTEQLSRFQKHWKASRTANEPINTHVSDKDTSQQRVYLTITFLCCFNFCVTK